MSETTLETLITALTRTRIYATLIAAAQAVGLNTESWQSGDPERTLFDAVARSDETRDAIFVDAIKGGFRTLAKKGWATLLARYNYGVERRAAEPATCTARITNASAATVGTLEIDDVTISNLTTGATYRNKTSGTLLGNAYVDLTFEAEVAGADGSSGVGEITNLVTSLPNCSVTNLTAAVGVDEERDEDLDIRTGAKLEALSPMGPKGIYHYVVTTPYAPDGTPLNPGTLITRTRVWAESDTGELTLFVAGASGAVDSDQIDAAQLVVEDQAEPHCIAATVVTATNVTQAITYTLWVYDTISLTSAEIQDKVETALLDALKVLRIGGDVIPPATSGFLYAKWIEAIILQAVAPFGFKLTLTTPAADVALTFTADDADVVVAGVITGTINQVAAS